MKEALTKRDAQLATERAEALQKVLKEAGAVIYAQSPMQACMHRRPIRGRNRTRRPCAAKPGRAAPGRAAGWWMPNTRKQK